MTVGEVSTHLSGAMQCDFVLANDGNTLHWYGNCWPDAKH